MRLGLWYYFSYRSWSAFVLPFVPALAAVQKFRSLPLVSVCPRPYVVFFRYEATDLSSQDAKVLSDPEADPLLSVPCLLLPCVFLLFPFCSPLIVCMQPRSSPESDVVDALAITPYSPPSTRERAALPRSPFLFSFLLIAFLLLPSVFLLFLAISGDDLSTGNDLLW